MSKIFGTNIHNDLTILDSTKYIFERIKSENWYLELSSDKKFENDKTLYENEKYIILIDGVILNLKLLLI